MVFWRKSEVRSRKSEVRSQKSEVGSQKLFNIVNSNPRLETRNTKPETRNPKPETAMHRLAFYSRVAFLCNICLLLTWLMRYAVFVPRGQVESTIVVAGLGLSFFV